MSQRPGSRNFPVTSTIFAPSGILIAERGPAATMRSPTADGTELLIAQGKRRFRRNNCYKAKSGSVFIWCESPRERHSIQEYSHRLDLQKRMLAWFDKHLK